MVDPPGLTRRLGLDLDEARRRRHIDDLRGRVVVKALHHARSVVEDPPDLKMRRFW